ncbi:MAG: enoyl-CoA hydratase-related protein, partial [Thermoplasmatota archaeon]
AHTLIGERILSAAPALARAARIVRWSHERFDGNGYPDGLAGADMGCAWLLPRIVGAGRATEILMLGDKVTADDALAYGLANRVVDNEALADETAALARRLADGPTFAFSATKLLLTREADMSLQAGIELEAWTQAYLMRSADHAEFFKAQAEKRPPAWTGR